MLKMRTEPANCGGGSVMASQSGIMTKSRQDVEAAFAIAQLSEQEPRGTDCHVRTASYKSDSQLTNGCSSPNTWNKPIFSHMRAAVMPNTCSRVERAAVKRRFDMRDGDLSERDGVSSYKQARLQDVVDPVQRAIESERGTFMTARRHQHVARTDTPDDNELVGRFVRTCGPSDRDDIHQQLYVKVSDHTVSPTLVSSVPSLFTVGSSSEREMTVGDDRPPVLSPAVTERSYLPLAVSQQHRLALRNDCNNTDTVRCWDARRTPTLKRYILPEYHQQIPAVLMSYEDSREKLTVPGTFGNSSACEIDGNRRNERLSSSLVSAYYNLGQTAAAAAAASQLLFVPQSVISRSLSGLSNSPAQLTSSCESRLRRVDSCTLRKVRRGEFGALSTLRLYCNQLRRHSEPSSSTDAVKVKQSADDDEVAVDLSMRKQTLSGDDEQRSDVSSLACYSASRSCGSSPNVRSDEVPERRQTVGQMGWRSTAVDHRQQPASCLSLPSSPYTCRHDDHRRSPLHRRQPKCRDTVTAAVDGTERTLNDVTEASDVIPDSRLPLKKRRLHYQQQSALSAISDDSSDKQWMTADCSDATRHEESLSSPSADHEVNETSADRLRCSQPAILRADEDGDLPLHIAVAKGTAAAVDSIMSIMLSLGVSLDYCNNCHQTALHLAVLTDQPDIVRRLLDCGASSNVVDQRGQTCLHIAVLLDSTTCLRLLLQQSRHPLHINAVSYDGVTALHLAVQRGNSDAVRCLLSAGADVDIVDSKYGRPALFYAVQRNDAAMIELLRSCGAKPALPTHSGSSAYSTKCSAAMLPLRQPANINYRYLPTCCPTG